MRNDVKFIDMELQEDTFDVEGVNVKLITYKRPSGHEYVAQLVFPGGVGEVSFGGATRGEAMVFASELLRALGQRLAQHAFQKEGAIRIP